MSAQRPHGAHRPAKRTDNQTPTRRRTPPRADEHANDGCRPGRPTPPPAADSDVQAAAGASSAAALSFADNLTDIPNGPSSPDDIAPGTRCGSYPSTTEKWGERRAMPRRQLPARGVSPADAGIPAAPAKLPAAPISCTATRPIAGAPGPDHAGDAGQCHPVRCGPVTGWKHDPERRCSDSADGAARSGRCPACATARVPSAERAA